MALSPCNRYPCFSDVNAKQQQFIQKGEKQCRIHLDLLYIIKLFGLKIKGTWDFVAGSGGFSNKGIQSKFLGLEEIFITLECTIHEGFIHPMACTKRKKKDSDSLSICIPPHYLLLVHAYFPPGYKYFPKYPMSCVLMLGQPCALIPVNKKTVFLLPQEKQGIKWISLDIGVNAFIPEWKQKATFHMIISFYNTVALFARSCWHSEICVHPCSLTEFPSVPCTAWPPSSVNTKPWCFALA